MFVQFELSYRMMVSQFWAEKKQGRTSVSPRLTTKLFSDLAQQF